MFGLYFWTFFQYEQLTKFHAWTSISVWCNKDQNPPKNDFYLNKQISAAKLDTLPIKVSITKKGK